MDVSRYRNIGVELSGKSSGMTTVIGRSRCQNRLFTPEEALWLRRSDDISRSRAIYNPLCVNRHAAPTGVYAIIIDHSEAKVLLGRMAFHKDFWNAGFPKATPRFDRPPTSLSETPTLRISNGVQ